MNISGLLSDPRLLDFGLGLLAQSGPTPGGPTPSLLQAIGRSGMRAFGTADDRLRNQLIRDRILQEQKKRKLLEQIPNLLSDTTTIQGQGQTVNVPGFGGQPETTFNIPGMKAQIPTQSTPQGQQKLMGLLAQAMPEEFASGLLNNMMQPTRAARVPTEIQEFESFFPGVDPGTAEGREKYLQWVKNKNPGADLEQLVKATTVKLNMMELEKNKNEEEQKQKDKKQQFQTGQFALNHSLDYLAEAAGLNAKLAPTFLSSGSVGVDLRSKAALTYADAMNLFGKSADEARTIADQYNRFKKLTSQMVVEKIGRISGSGAGGATNQKMQLLAASLGGIGATPGTNALIFADSMQQLLDTADIEGYPVEDRDKYEKLIQQLHQIARPGQQVRPIDLGNGAMLEINPGG